MNIKIREGTLDDSGFIASLICKANTPVAKRFGLTNNNAPKHPSNCTKEWIESDIKRGVKYFIAEKDDLLIGCIAYESPKNGLAYLNRLAVLPKYQKKGVGRLLVDYHLEYCSKSNINIVSLGTIDEHTKLKNWYLELGFVVTEIKKFDHLPFTVCLMNYKF